MPQAWDVTDPNTGRTITLRQDHQPTIDEIRAAFAQPGMGPATESPVAPSDTPSGAAAVLSRIQDEFDQKHTAMDQSAPTIAALAAAPFTAGMSIPAAAATTGGAAGLTSLVRDWLSSDETTLPASLWNASKEAVVQAALQAGGEILAKAAPGAKRLARNLWVRVAKPSEAVAKRTQTALAGGSLPAAKQEIAETALSMGRGTLRSGNARAMHASLDDLDAQLSAVIAGSTKTVPRAALENAVLDFYAQAKYANNLDKMAAAERVFDGLSGLPADIPIQQAQAIKQEVYATTPYVAGSMDAAMRKATKVKGRALRQEIAAAEPAVTPINAALTRQIPATSAIDAAINRAGNANPVRLSGTLATMSPRAMATGAVAAVNSPMGGSFVAQQLYRAAPFLAAAGLIAPQFVRVLQTLAEAEEPPPQ